MFNKHIFAAVLLVLFLGSCSTFFPYKPHLIGITKDNTMVNEKGKFASLTRFYAVMSVKDIKPIPQLEAEAFNRMTPIVEELLASKSICPNGFFFLKNSLNFYEGAKVSATIECY